MRSQCQVGHAIELGIRLLLMHEVSPMTPDQEARHGVNFEAFFSCAAGSTPDWLLAEVQTVGWIDPPLLPFSPFHFLPLPLSTL